ncbi:MAG: ATP-dependent DNA helicase RecG [Pseudomonadota bacterium]
MAVSVTELHGVGSSLASKLEKLSIFTVSDLLFHLPLRYQDRTRLTKLAHLQPGNYAGVEGTIESVQVIMGRRRSMLCRISDGGHYLHLRFFHFSLAQKRALEKSERLYCFGEVRLSKYGLEMVHPQYRLIRQDAIIPVEETLTAIYPTVSGISQTSWQKLIKQALDKIARDESILTELLPAEICRHYQFSSIKQVLQYIHRPPPDADADLLTEGHHPYQKRLAFEELLAHHLSLQQLRQRATKYPALSLRCTQQLSRKFLHQLPFKLTKAQQRVNKEIQADLEKSYPMLRLVQGDVGSGKTVIAALAILTALEHGCQAALMAPTELLAEQHYRNFVQWMSALDIETAWLSSSLTAKQKRSTLENIAMGKARLVIGTHALFQQQVVFKKLSLLVIDEQHRFGVHQRLALKEKGVYKDYHPHQLIMTATPIPRTLAMSIYADLDVSIIDELPPGRTPIQTVVVNNNRRDEVIERIRHFCRQGHQAYWVCTLIEESEKLQAQAAENIAEQLKQLLPEFSIGLVHGRLAEKEQVMTDFKNKQIDLLVATTVIEVGVDVPNAGLMVIENAERLGLSQLHQLRGRVGRGTIASHCILLYQIPLSENGKKRLAIMRQTQDGFRIAEEDLKIRGPGEVLGTKQTGMISMRVANLLRDQKMLPDVQKTATTLLQHHPQQASAIVSRWLPEMAEYYASV